MSKSTVFWLKMPRTEVDLHPGRLRMTYLDKTRGLRRTLPLALGLAAIGLLANGVGSADAGAPNYHVNFGPGKIVALPPSVPHADGVMVDKRIVDNLRRIAGRYAIYVEEGYSGPLPGVGQVGCRKCHVENSDHYFGLAADIIPLRWDGHGCDGSWKPVTNLARWAEPRQNHPRLPFRWVGYNHDADHGCGDHLHLSWEHADARKFHLADWVTVFDVPWPRAEPPEGPFQPEPVNPPGRETAEP
jgi:hypothetical protein